MTIMMEKFKHAYYMRQAQQGKKHAKIIKRRNEDEISLLFENLAPETLDKAAKQLIDEFHGYGKEPRSENKRILNLVEEAVWRLERYSFLKTLVSSSNNAAFYADKMLQRKHEEIMRFLASASFTFEAEAVFNILLRRGNSEELKMFVSKFNGFVFAKLIKWVLSSEDKTLVKRLFSKNIAWSDGSAEEILNSGNKKNILLLAEHHLSSVGIQNILNGKYGISLTEDEAHSLESRLSGLKKQEKVWAEIAYEFDCIR